MQSNSQTENIEEDQKVGKSDFVVLVRPSCLNLDNIQK